MVLWPLSVLIGLATLLGVMYLHYVVDPEKNLHDFPIALVNQDLGEVTSSGDDAGQRVNFGDQIARALVQGVPSDKVDLRLLGINEAEQQMQYGQVYGAIIIPSDFSKQLTILGVGSVVPADIRQPTITVQTNPRAGPYATQIMLRVSDQATAEANKRVGEQLTEQVIAQTTQQPGGGPGPELSGAAKVVLAQPIQVIVEAYHPLPPGSGQGLTAFFYALLLLLAGVIGAMVIHTMIDAQLGFAPTEYGPWYVHYPPTPISRFKTLMIKWGVFIVAAHVMSGVFLIVAHVVDMTVEHALALFLYSALAMIAVGVTALSTLAALGTAGLLMNLVVFIVLGLPSSAGTIPIEATPKYFGVLAEFEPMHQVFLGIRSILYFDANLDAGLARGIWMSLLGLAIGLVFGVVVTHFYDRRGLVRGHRS
ncbi:YhgE/Pip domain-containing protein [Nocardia sp. CNY236]|uniref:YhgE/Pip domain-containing protein n=1 Tax=Nocardia sp. CNY236 TaxID=1169152 RepID=UPI0004161266|nr:DUF3533 domain-containing protein [Nocardia sp. CNY236]